MTYLRFANAGLVEQAAVIYKMCREFGPLYDYFARLRDMDLPDAWIVSGAIYNNIWNYLTDRPAMHGVKDVDIFYYDADAITYDEEDKIISEAEAVFAGMQVPVEVRNQARVHLWYPAHFGFDYPKLDHSREAIDRFACTTHSVGMRLNDQDRFELYAPYGLNDIFSFKLVPNYNLPNKDTHYKKGERLCALWPELALESWVDEVPAHLVPQPDQTLSLAE
ncbi:nucleotidyltransferase family protein [Maritalea mediterranea]|uniref:Nucleotidyltransferase family protein n=1 Tax=Maritalea mediterranea TaxID=2909667 RepID=A0ABS9ECR9_9HYPH|nr:nucleotidyltransferase family protein [Maritalea mediterranea]MCF4099525.1 nucleotidyltransferase family protein [Maritalea mediterranea]